MNVILMTRCNQSDEFRTVLPAKMCARVLLILMLASAAVLVVGAGGGTAAEESEIIFIGTAIEYHEASMPGAPWGWTVSADEIFSGPEPCSGYLNVTTAAVAPPCGNMDPDIVEGMEIEVYGYYSEDQSGCGVSLVGSESYYLKENNWGAFWVEFKGNATTDEDYTDVMCSGSYYCMVKVEEILHDPYNTLEVGNEYPVCYGSTQKNIKAGDKLEVSGDYYPTWGSLQCVGNVMALWDGVKKIPSELRVHNIDTDKYFSTIQESIYDPGTLNGHTIMVEPGTYTENVDVTKSLTIKSTSINPDDAIVKAKDPSDHVFYISADYVNISGFKVTGATEYPYPTAGIYLNGVEYCNISDNIASDNSHGVYLNYSHNNALVNNNVSNGHIGIHLYYSNGNSLTNNNATNHSGESIYLYSSNYNTLTENNVSNNYAGIILEYSSNDNVLTNNNISNDYYGIMLWKSSNNNKIYLNNFINNTDSVSSYESTNFWNSTEEITYTYNGNTYTNHLGNYWDGYTDVDAENDGIWDHPYSIYHEEKDYYPLVKGFENYLTIGLSKVIYGFWPHWKDSQSYQPDWSGLTHVSYFCMDANSNGTLNTSHIGADYDNIRNTAHSHNVKVTLTVTCFDHNIQDDILAYHRNDLVNNISQKLQYYGADGVSIDFEDVGNSNSNTGKSNTVLMEQFMQTLHDTLKNADHKYHISFCVQGWVEPVYRNAALSQYTDAVFLMGYDYHIADYNSSHEWANSTGAVSPYNDPTQFDVIESVERLCDYYPKDKIILGVPFYGYDWACESKLPGAKRLDSNGTGVEMKYAITYAQNNESLWDSNSHTPWYRYNQSDTWHQCWYDNETSLGLKFDYVNSANLAGTGFWALGYEGNNADIWNVVKEKFSGHGLTIGELIEKLNDDPESVVNKKFATNGFVYASTHEAWEEVEILNDLLVAIEKATIDPLPLPEPIKNLVKELLNYISPARVWDYCFGLDSMIIMSTSESDQTYGCLPCIQAYAEDDNLWPEQGSVVHIEGTWEKRSILWKNIGYIFKVDKVIVDKSYKNFEDIEDLGENAEVKMMAVIAKERIASDNTYHFLSGPKLDVYLKLPEGVQISNLAITEIHGEITDKSYKDKKVEYTITVDNLRILLADHDAQLQSPDRSKESIIIDCPVNATITDYYGRIISDNGTNQIPNASLLVTNDTKIFHLPADLTYSTEIDAYDTGIFNFTRVSPIGTDISITKFENISITASTKTFVEIKPNVTNYTMSIDYDGDGVYETNITPDVNETIVITPTHEITKQITASADDGYSSPAEHYDSTANLTMVGTFGEVDFNGWYRFQNVTIPAGADITRAFVTLTAYSDFYTEVPDDTLKTVIRAEYAADPLPPSSASDHAGRTRTPHSVEWDITEWEAGEIYSSPDISDIIQGLANVHDYSSGAAIQIFHDATDNVPTVLYQPEAASDEGYITTCTYDHSPLDAARLYIEYTMENQPPTASFTYAPENPSTNQTITFDASSSTDPDGNIISYAWDFGDENTTTTTEEIITHFYASEGDYNVNLTVTDDGGAKHSASKTITVTILRGDVNHDGVIAPADAMIVLEMAARGGWDEDADVDNDDMVTSLDALMILQVAAGNIEL